MSIKKSRFISLLLLLMLINTYTKKQKKISCECPFTSIAKPMKINMKFWVMAKSNKNAYKLPNLVQVFSQHKSIPKEFYIFTSKWFHKVNFLCKCQSLLSQRILYFCYSRIKKWRKQKGILIFNLIGSKRKKKIFSIRY